MSKKGTYGKSEKVTYGKSKKVPMENVLIERVQRYLWK